MFSMAWLEQILRLVRINCFGGIGFVFSLFLACGLISSRPIFAKSLSGDMDLYKLDPSHTQALFKVSHLGFSYTVGQFTEIQGELAIDEKTPTKSKVNVEIATKSVSTHHSDRDEHLHKADFFDAKKYPKITFSSTKISKKSEKVYLVEGNLKIHGREKPVKFEFTRMRTGPDMQGKTRTGGFASFSIKRSDFGMNYMQGEDKIGDDVEITLNLEAVIQPKD